MGMTRPDFLKASLAALSAPLVWLVSRPEVVELKPVDLDLDQIEGDTRLKFNQGHEGQILVYDGNTSRWQGASTSMFVQQGTSTVVQQNTSMTVRWKSWREQSHTA